MSAGVNMLPPYVSTRRSVRLLSGLLFACAGLSWVAVGYDFGEMLLAGSLIAGAHMEPAQRWAHSVAGELVGTLQVACFAFTAIFFVIWLHRTRVNVRALGMRRLAYGREWTLLAFVVPFLNLVRPYAVISEVWRASDPACGDPFEWKVRRAPPILGVWWGTLLAFLALWLLSTTVLHFATGLARIQFAYGVAMAADVCAAVSASLAYFVIHGVTQDQDAKHEAWGVQTDLSAPAVFDPRDALAT